MQLTVLDDRLAICRLEPDAEIPAWAAAGGFTSFTRTADELSVVCPEAGVPPGVRKDSGWRAIQVQGPLDFGLTGVLAAIAVPLAGAGVSIFAISSFNTDYVLVKESRLDVATRALRAAGHTFVAA